MKTATCIEIQKLDDGATFFRFDLSEPCEFMGAQTTHFDVIKSKESTQFIGDNRAWVQFMTGMFGGGEPRTILSMNYGYEETRLSQLRRQRGHWNDLDNPPIDYIPHETARLWPHFDEELRLVISIMADESARLMAEFREEHSSDYVDDIDDDWSE